MAESRIGRREMLVGAGAGAAGALAVLGGLGTTTIAKADDDDDNPVVGSWLITATTEGGTPPPFPLVASFAPGGIAAASDGSSAPGVTYLGAWDGDADGFEVRYLIFQFSSPNSIAIGWVRVDVRGTVHGHTASGTFTSTFVPLSGSPQPAGKGTFTGHPIIV